MQKGSKLQNRLLPFCILFYDVSCTSFLLTLLYLRNRCHRLYHIALKRCGVWKLEKQAKEQDFEKCNLLPFCIWRQYTECLPNISPKFQGFKVFSNLFNLFFKVADITFFHEWSFFHKVNPLTKLNLSLIFLLVVLSEKLENYW